MEKLFEIKLLGRDLVYKIEEYARLDEIIINQITVDGEPIGFELNGERVLTEKGKAFQKEAELQKFILSNYADHIVWEKVS